jgi:nucleoside triphosphate diphosphatase
MSDPVAALLAIMARLRDSARGCPWDLAQSFATIAPYTIEEAYEVADAIEALARTSPDPGTGAGEGQDLAVERLRDELGDLLFQVVFHARLAQERGWFDFADVARAIGEKLTRRHPHVFGERAASVDDATLSERWEEQKARERASAAARRGEVSSSTLADVPLALPALLRAAKLGKRAGRVGFDWPTASGVREKVLEELREVDAAAEAAAQAAGGAAGGAEAAAHVTEEVGDLLFAVANWARHLGADPESALRAANAKFERRFECMERLARARGLTLTALSLEEWEALWRESKLATAAP